MREDGQINKASPAADNCCASRQSVQSLLKEHADRLRRQAGYMHQEADRIEQLASCAIGLPSGAEEALYRMVIEGIRRPAPGLF